MILNGKCKSMSKIEKGEEYEKEHKKSACTCYGACTYPWKLYRSWDNVESGGHFRNFQCHNNGKRIP